MAEEKLNEWIRKEIRALDAVRSTGILTVVRPEDKHKEAIEENLIDDEGEGEDWGPWQ